LKNIESQGNSSYYLGMKFIKYLLEDPLYSKIIKWVFLALVSVSIFLAIYFTSERTLVNACNATFAPGCVMIVLAFFSIVNYFGGFDFVEYGFVSGFNSLKKGSPLEYEDLIDYKQKKKASRKEDSLVFLPYLVYGGIFLIASLVLLLLFKASV
jgi:hypothetical protein